MTDVTVLDTATADRYADVLKRVAESFTAGDVDGAEAQLEPIVDDRWLGSVKMAPTQEYAARSVTHRDVPDRLRAAVFLRDRFRCTYCGGRAVPRCVLVAISDAFPRFGYQAHYKRGMMHPAFWALAPEADHTLAHARGGAGELENLTTLHAMCNTAKGAALADELPIIARTAAQNGWDGLISSYPAIVQAGNLRGARHASANYHAMWLRIFGLAPIDPVTDPSA
ncbi:HNH endonuclease [Curtobacterium sp. UNCCL17]|uniref:HNH endonuclease n=1 Tax=Curtobacterium sp. UNCCL17 TaxID=1449051 RepID=UPI00048392B8|nr:HNH endonuclease [Curtobacterium sp. UNCCL17]